MFLPLLGHCTSPPLLEVNRGAFGGVGRTSQRLESLPNSLDGEPALEASDRKRRSRSKANDETLVPTTAEVQLYVTLHFLDPALHIPVHPIAQSTSVHLGKCS